MSKTLEHIPVSILIPVIEEVPRISDAEREELRASLAQAHADIANGDYDVVTSDTLQAEFEGIFRSDNTDEELDEILAHSSNR